MKALRGMFILLGSGIILTACSAGGPTNVNISEKEAAEIQQKVEQRQRGYDEKLSEVLGEELETIRNTINEKEENLEISHQTIPQSPPPAEQILTDSVSYPSADESRAVSGDNYNENLFERPFTAGNMQFQAWLDIQEASLSQDDFFYYFSIVLYEINENDGFLDGAYGVELDTDKDGRGDYLAWAIFPKQTRWSVQRVILLEDANGDVGGAQPMVSDATWKNGDGYETRLFIGGKFGSDVDAAWVRILPKDDTIVQIAIKKDSIGMPSSFLWSAWADGGLKAPGAMDYNDSISLEEAGSPLITDEDYPLKIVRSVDNTCRKAYNFTLSDDIPGTCTGGYDEKQVPDVRVTPDLQHYDPK